MARVSLIFILVLLVCPHVSFSTDLVMMDFLTESPSIRANAAGQTGVARTDLGTSFFNPATVAYISDQGAVVLSGYLISHRGNRSVYTYSGSGGDQSGIEDAAIYLGREFHLGDGALPIKIGVGFNSTSNKAGAATYYYNYDPFSSVGSSAVGPVIPYTGITSSGKSHSISAAAAIAFPLEFGIGLSLKTGEQTGGYLHNYDFTAVDFGFVLRVPSSVLYPKRAESGGFFMSPSFGASWSNYGSDPREPSNSVNNIAWQNSQGDTQATNYPLPRTRRIGMAVDFGSTGFKGNKSWENYAVVMAFDIEDRLIRYTLGSGTRLGLELRVVDAVSASVGTVSYDGINASQKTFGFSLNSVGLFRMFYGNDNSHSGLTDKISLRLDFATILGINDGPSDRYLGFSLGLNP